MANNEEMYTSIYSGQEIDAAVGFGYNPDNLPIENSPRGVKSGGVYTAIKTAKETLERQIVNRNLLDNPYFKIDQRKGYIVPPNTEMFGIDGTSGTWTTDNYYKVVNFYTYNNIEYAQISANGGDYACVRNQAVRGYCESGYTADRYLLQIESDTKGKMVITDDYVEISKTGGSANIVLKQRLSSETVKQMRGHSAIFSFVTDDGIKTLLWENISPTDWSIYSPTLALDNGWYVSMGIYAGECFARYWTGQTANSLKIYNAQKLELGSVSTLEAEIASGDYDEDADLLACMRYFQRLNFGKVGISLSGKSIGISHARVSTLPFVPFRADPSISYSAAADFICSYDGNFTTINAINNFSVKDFISLQFETNGTVADNQDVCIWNHTATHIDLSADI